MSNSNKVRVTAIKGGGADLGLMDPVLRLVCQEGTIIGRDSGDYQVTVSGAGVGLPKKYYPHQLTVDVDVASGTFSWPSGDGSIRFGRNQLWPNGVPVNTGSYLGSGMCYSDGDGPPIGFSR